MKLHIFNPEHDLALAANSPHWTSPHAGRQLRSDLCWIPALWADEGDYVLVDDVDYATVAYGRMKLPNKQKVHFVTARMLPAISIYINKVCPWGWDQAIVHQLRLAGVADSLLPSLQVLDAQRAISDRSTAKHILDDIKTRLTPGLADSSCAIVGEARIVTTIDELSSIVDEWGRVVLKAPWSSSGRGVKFVDDLSVNNIIRWANNIIRSQGHLMVERYLDKVMDFGMEFTALPDGTIRYDGLSLFKTENNAYTGSILATEEEKQELLSRYIPKQVIMAIQQYYCSLAAEEYAHLLPVKDTYCGPFGVDMMLVASPSAGYPAFVNPCVEVNLRRTMGHVALALSPSDLCQQLIMRVGYEGTNYHLRLFNDHEIYI